MPKYLTKKKSYKVGKNSYKTKQKGGAGLVLAGLPVHGIGHAHGRVHGSKKGESPIPTPTPTPTPTPLNIPPQNSNYPKTNQLQSIPTTNVSTQHNQDTSLKTTKKLKTKKHRPKWIKKMDHDKPVSVKYIKLKVSQMTHIKNGEMHLYDLKILFLYLNFVVEFIFKGDQSKYTSRPFTNEAFYKIISDYHIKKLFKLNNIKSIL
jgi:hypothetical protein